MAKAIVSVQVSKKDRGKIDKAFKLPWDDGEPGKKKDLAYSLEDLQQMDAETARTAKKIK